MTGVDFRRQDGDGDVIVNPAYVELVAVERYEFDATSRSMRRCCRIFMQSGQRIDVVGTVAEVRWQLWPKKRSDTDGE